MHKVTFDEIKLEKPEQGLEDLQKDFLSDRENELPRLEKAILDSDFTSVSAIAHNWKGFCKPYGFQLLGELSESLDLASKSKDSKMCLNLKQNINSYLKIKREILVG